MASIKHIQLYPNTEDARAISCLDQSPEYVFGDETAQFFLHDSKLGEYYYIDPTRVED